MDKERKERLGGLDKERRAKRKILEAGKEREVDDEQGRGVFRGRSEGRAREWRGAQLHTIPQGASCRS